MARGWESKSVEAQQEEAGNRPAESRPRMTPQEAALWRKRENLRLSRLNLLKQLETSQNPRHRQLLEETLRDLEQKMGIESGTGL
jgi:hypothetical protein